MQWETIVKKWWWIWWYLGIQYLFVILPALFAINANVPCLDKPFRTWLFSKSSLKDKTFVEITPRLEELLSRLKTDQNNHLLPAPGQSSLLQKINIYSNTYNDGDKKKILTFEGIMNEDEKIFLFKLTENVQEEKIINSLFNQSQHNFMHNLKFIKTLRENIKNPNFNPLVFATYLIALNESCAILPFILFFNTIITFLLLSKLKIWKGIIFSCLTAILLLSLQIPECILIFIIIFIFLLYPYFSKYKNFRYYFSVFSMISIILIIWLPLKKSVNNIILNFSFSIFLIMPLWIFYKRYGEKVYISNNYLTKYILFRHPIIFFGGVFYNIVIYVFLCIAIANVNESEKPLNLSALSLISIWIASLAMWMGPFVWAWIRTFSKDFIDEYYRKATSQIIANLTDHQVMLGYGELGQGIQTELLERMKKSDLIKIKEPFLDPSYGSAIQYMAKNMVIVDRDEKLFDHVFNDPSFEKIGVAKAKYRDIELKKGRPPLSFKKEELWIPAIIGDVTNASVLDYSGLERCNFFIDTIEGYEESIRISKFARDHSKTRGIITVSDSAQKKLLFPKHSGHGVFLTYPAQQRGISLAEVVYPAMAGWLNDDKLPNVLVFSDNLRQTHYMIETIFQELKMGDRLSKYINGKWRNLPYSGEYVDLRITLCGEAEEIIRVCCPKIPVNKIPGELDVRNWVEIIERCASPEYAWPDVKYYIKSRVIVEKPHLMTMEKMIKKLRPEVVVISYKKTANILKVLHDWIVAVERHNKLTSDNWDSKTKIMPKIIVGYQGEEERDVRDWLLYYDTLCSEKCCDENKINWQRYPVQAIDCRVDLNKDSKEQIAAIAEAMSNNKR